ncbi:MAG TPA: hypothetical protein VKE92_07490 [Anaerolineales bacterium]|nr:hypothetical protein [Anaerolineales bacterium]
MGEFIQQNFSRTNLWIPAEDSGVDLLVSDLKRRKMVSLQVKFSRDFLATHMPAAFQKPLRAGFQSRSTDFVIIKPTELLKRLNVIHEHSRKMLSLALKIKFV